MNFQFHPNKCKVIAITNKPRIYPLPFYELWYSLNGKDLDYVHVSNEKDLGVVIDSKLSWNSQCEMLVSKATKQFNLLRMHLSPQIPLKTLKIENRSLKYGIKTLRYHNPSKTLATQGLPPSKTPVFNTINTWIL